MTALLLFLKHRPVAYAIARDYYLPGSDSQDVRQEALIALWRACQEYKSGEKVPFQSYAGVVITRHLKSAVRNANRLKQLPLNESVRASFTDEGEENPALLHVAGGREPFDVVWEREEIAQLVARSRELTDTEAHALAEFLNGRWGRGIDKALWRARRKLKAAA